jgi:DNA invertase Pin-like site-specific DNA recombinase
LLAQELKASDVGLKFHSGELEGSHAPSSIVFTVLAAIPGMERVYIRNRALEGHESARKRGKTIKGAGLTGDSMLSTALHLRDSPNTSSSPRQEEGGSPSASAVIRMLHEHDGQAVVSTPA